MDPFFLLCACLEKKVIIGYSKYIETRCVPWQLKHG